MRRIVGASGARVVRRCGRPIAFVAPHGVEWRVVDLDGRLIGLAPNLHRQPGPRPEVAAMIRQLRERLAEIERRGLIVLSVDRARRYKIRVAAPDGRATLLTVSSTANDAGCGRKPFAAQLKRFTRSDEG
jgi:hypothetical protein